MMGKHTYRYNSFCSKWWNSGVNNSIIKENSPSMTSWKPRVFANFLYTKFLWSIAPCISHSTKKINHQNHRITTKFTPVSLLHKRTWGVSVIFTDTSKPSAKLHVRIAQPCYLPYFQKNKYHLKVYMNSVQQNYYPMFITYNVFH